MTTGSNTAEPTVYRPTYNNNTAEFMTDWTPWLEPHYRAQFWFNPNGITLATNDAHYIFYAISHDGALGVARVELVKTSAGYKMRVGALTDASKSSFVGMALPTTTVPNALHKIETEWKAATAPGANNGVLTLWIDGTQIDSLTNLDNDTRRVDGAQLGPVAGIDTGTAWYGVLRCICLTAHHLHRYGGARRIAVASIPLPVQPQTDGGVRMAAFTRAKQQAPVGDAYPV